MAPPPTRNPNPRQLNQAPARRPSGRRSGRKSGPPLLLAAAFVFAYGLAALLWRVPIAVGLGYLVLSALTFMVYAVDKAAARANRQRVPEKTLHILALIGGWPGALVAQEWLRHKSVKPAFRAVFWITVAINIGVFVFLASPYGRSLLAPYVLALN